MHITSGPILLDKFFCFVPDVSCGALASFVGLVRDHDHGRCVKELYYECYQSMAEKIIDRLIEEAHEKWGIGDARVLHRVGRLDIGQAAVVIAVSAAHREEALAAVRFLIEQIKSRVPIWKKQIFENGENEWVACHHSAGYIA